MNIGTSAAVDAEGGNMKQKVEVNGGIGVLGLLGVVFITLKLLGVIDWSWWLVTLPFWGGLALAVSIVGIALICVCLVEIFQKRK